MRKHGEGRDEVLRLHTLHPKWTSGDIAREMGCLAAYVRKVLQRQGQQLYQGRPTDSRTARRITLCARQGARWLTMSEPNRRTASRPPYASAAWWA
jgi:hypothetical protein